MIWCAIIWYGVVWYGVVWYGIVWYGVVWYGHASRILLPNILPQSNLPFISASTELAAFQTKTTLVTKIVSDHCKNWEGCPMSLIFTRVSPMSQVSSVGHSWGTSWILAIHNRRKDGSTIFFLGSGSKNVVTSDMISDPLPMSINGQ